MFSKLGLGLNAKSCSKFPISSLVKYFLCIVRNTDVCTLMLIYEIWATSISFEKWFNQYKYWSSIFIWWCIQSSNYNADILFVYFLFIWTCYKLWLIFNQSLKLMYYIKLCTFALQWVCANASQMYNQYFIRHLIPYV